jgi:DNA repair protein RadC
MEKNIHKGHRQRIKKRFLSDGLDSFTDYQILEFLLFYSIPLKDTNTIAHNLLKKYGSLSGVFEADAKDLVKTSEIGLNSSVLLSLIPSLCRRYYKDKWGEKPVLCSVNSAGKYAVSLFAGHTYEVFYVICLDARNRVNFADPVHKGTINEAPIYPRLIVETALRHHANSVILAHNHPGGSLAPSNADLDVTEKISGALNGISIKVVDHIIVAGSDFTSFAEKGLL